MVNLRTFLKQRIEDRQERIVSIQLRLHNIAMKLYPSVIDRMMRPVWRRRISALKGWQTRDKQRLNELPGYNVVEYTKFYNVIVVDPNKTPELSFEVRGQFTIPAELSIYDPNVLNAVDVVLSEVFKDWGKPWQKRVFASPMTKVMKEADARRQGIMPPQFIPRDEGGWWEVQMQGGIDLKYFEEVSPSETFGAEATGEEVDEYQSAVEVEIIKRENRKVVGEWAKSATVPESAFVGGE